MDMAFLYHSIAIGTKVYGMLSLRPISKSALLSSNLALMWVGYVIRVVCDRLRRCWRLLSVGSAMMSILINGSGRFMLSMLLLMLWLGCMLEQK